LDAGTVLVDRVMLPGTAVCSVTVPIEAILFKDIIPNSMVSIN